MVPCLHLVQATDFLAIANGCTATSRCEEQITHVLDAYLDAIPAADAEETHLPAEDQRTAFEAACADQKRERTAAVLPLRER